MSLVKSVLTGAENDSGKDEVIVRLANGRVIQISPDFNCINVWAPGAWDKENRPYCVESQFTSFQTDMGGANV